MITLYDIPSTHPKVYWSPNVCRTRFLFNYLRIPYKVQWINIDEITPEFKKLGVKPNSFHPPYWVPTIRLADGDFLMASDSILEFCERNFMNKIYPSDEYMIFSREFIKWFDFTGKNKLHGLIFWVVIPHCELILKTDAAKAKFNAEKGIPLLGKGLAELRSRQEKNATCEADCLDFLSNFRNEFPGYEGFDRSRFATGKYLYGNMMTYADILAAAMFQWIINVSEAQPNHFFRWPKGSRWLRLWFENMLTQVSTSALPLTPEEDFSP